jgi:hypothetical protein
LAPGQAVAPLIWCRVDPLCSAHYNGVHNQGGESVRAGPMGTAPRVAEGIRPLRVTFNAVVSETLEG